MSRPLLYMHLDRLEKAGLVTGRLELSGDGKAMKYIELVPFEMRITAETAVRALAKVGANVHSHQAMPGDVQPSLPQVNGTPGDMGLRQATGRS